MPAPDSATPAGTAPPDEPIATRWIAWGRRAVPFRIPARAQGILDDVFRRGDYAVPPLPGWSATTVVDVGANAGAFALHAALSWPDARILCFEPVAASYALLRENLAGFPNVETVPAALLDRTARLPIWLGRNNPGEASLRRGAQQGDRSEQVEVRPAAAELAARGVAAISVLKLDTEGSELAILSDLVPLLPATDFVLVEYHLDADRRAIDALLGDAFLLYGGRIEGLHRGVLRYAARRLLLADPEARAYLEREAAK